MWQWRELTLLCGGNHWLLEAELAVANRTWSLAPPFLVQLHFWRSPFPVNSPVAKLKSAPVPFSQVVILVRFLDRSSMLLLVHRDFLPSWPVHGVMHLFQIVAWP